MIFYQGLDGELGGVEGEVSCFWCIIEEIKEHVVY
jgi:hypothetical protein